MASKGKLNEAAGASISGFFSNAEPDREQSSTAKPQEQPTKQDTLTDKKPLNGTEKEVLRLYNSGITVQNDIAAAMGKNKGTISHAMSRIKADYPELLTEKQTQGTPQTAQNAPEAIETQKAENLPQDKEKAPEKANTKPKKQVFSFRAAVDNISDWKAYATATGETMETIGAAAMNEYLKNHVLTAEQAAAFNALKRL